MSELAVQPLNLPANTPIYDHFTAEKKRLFLENYSKCPNLTGVAEALGQAKQVIYYHLERDPEFKRQFEAVKEGLVDNLEGKVYEYGQRPQNFMDRIAFLRAYRPGTWNPDRKVSVDINVNQLGSVINKANAYDAELVASDDKTVSPSSNSLNLPAPKSPPCP